jgi:hypothetical protein
MMEHTKIGKAIRRHLIEVEKKFQALMGGFILPQLEAERNLFGETTSYNYKKLLMSCGCSVTSSCVSSRRHKNPQEFWKNQTKEWIVSECFGLTIVANASVRKLNNEAKQRRIGYEARKQFIAERT